MSFPICIYVCWSSLYSCNSLGLSWWNQGAGRFSWHWLRLQWSGALPARSAPVATTLLALLRSEGMVSLSRERSSGCSGRGDLKSTWPSDVISDVKDNWYVGAVSNGLVDWKAKWLCIKMLSKLLFHDIYMVVFCVFTAPVSPIASHLPWSLQWKFHSPDLAESLRSGMRLIHLDSFGN